MTTKREETCGGCNRPINGAHCCVVPRAVHRTPDGTREKGEENIVLPSVATEMGIGREGCRCHARCANELRGNPAFDVSAPYGASRASTWAHVSAECRIAIGGLNDDEGGDDGTVR